MFRTTFLGHQGWLFEAGDSRILVDPLLCEELVNPSGRFQHVYPPRQWSWDKLPPIDAVIYSHLHEDHFDVNALAKLDRSIPIYVSGRSAALGHDVLEKMGFTQRFWARPGVPLIFGDLELVPLSAEHSDPSFESPGEWDTIPFVVKDRAGHGSMFSCVDVWCTPKVIQRAQKHQEQPGLIGFTWNMISTFWQNNWEPEAPELERLQLPHAVLDMLRTLSAAWGTPKAMLFSGAGLSFAGDVAHLNQAAFPFEPFGTFEALNALPLATRFFAPAPGDTVVMKDGEIVERTGSAFLGTPPREQWPSRVRAAEVPRLEEYPPACGRTQFSDEDGGKLVADLGRTAVALYDGPLFKEFLSLDAEDLGGRKATFAFVLKVGDEGAFKVLEFDPSRCAFVLRESEDPMAEYPLLVECWGSDLCAVTAGEISSTELWMGHCRFWSEYPERFGQVSLIQFLKLFHPLYDPETSRRMYERQIGALMPAAPVVKAAPRRASRVA